MAVFGMPKYPGCGYPSIDKGHHPAAGAGPHGPGTVRELTPVTRDNRPEQTQWDGPLPVWEPLNSSASVGVYEFESGAKIKDGTAGDFQRRQDLCGAGPYDAGYNPVNFLTRAYSARTSVGNRTMFSQVYAPEPTPDPAKHETALDILKASGLVEAVNEEQNWWVEEFIGSVTADHIVYITVQWENAVKTDGPFRHNVCGGTKILEHPVPWGNVIALLVEIDIDLKQVTNLDPDSPTLPEGLTWDEERKRAPQLLLTPSGPRPDGKLRADEIVTVYSLEDWNVLYNGARKNIPSDLLRCPLGFKSYRD